VISVLPRRRRGILDSIVMWYPRKTPFATKYMKCDFSAITQEERNARLDCHVVPKKDTFRYLGSMLQKDGDIDEDVSHIIKVD
jgi:hypothetical protein